jgi:hypothetical protein
MYEDTNDIEI